jgi:hypothetical protein
VVGVVNSGRTGKPTLFTLRSHDMSPYLAGDPGFPERLVSLYRVAQLDWGTKCVEVESGKKDLPPWGDLRPKRARARV